MYFENIKIGCHNFAHQVKFYLKLLRTQITLYLENDNASNIEILDRIHTIFNLITKF